MAIKYFIIKIFWDNICNNLLFNKHIDYICKQTYFSLHSIFRCIITKSPRALLNSYTMYYRPILE